MQEEKVLEYNTVAFNDDEEFWISKNTIVRMFETSVTTVTKLINKSFKCGEIDIKTDRKQYIVKTKNGKNKLTYFYSMNVVYAIVPHLKTQKAIKYIKKMIEYGNNYLFQLYMNSTQSFQKDA